MNLRNTFLAAVLLWPATCRPVVAADNHRVIVLDMMNKQRGLESRLLVLEVESGKLSAQVDVGMEPEFGMSTRGDLAAVVTYNVVGGVTKPNPRLQVFRTSDLTRLETGLLPFTDRVAFMDNSRTATLFFSPDQQEIILQHLKGSMTDEKPLKWPYYYAMWGFVKPSLDTEGFYKVARPALKIPRSRLSTFLRLSDWPRVCFWNDTLAVVEVVDVSNGAILSRLPLDYEDDPALRVIDPAYLEKPEIGELYMRMKANGLVISDLAAGGPYAYYIPRPLRNQKTIEAGFIQKIDLRTTPPKVVRKGDQRQPGLWAGTSAVSETGGAIFVAVEKQEKGKPTGQGTNRVRIYSTLDLKFQNEIELSLTSCDGMEPSRDGKYMYALSTEQGKVAVINIATGKEVKVLQNVGKYPVLIMALPQPVENK